MDAGIPVVNLDREFTARGAYRTLIKGDNYGMGVAAGALHRREAQGQGVSNPVIAEIAGIDELQLTQDALAGFNDTLAAYGFKVSQPAWPAAVHRRVRPGRSRPNLLQAAPKIDAIWNHDDDQGVGVLAAIQQANRKEFFMVGGAGSRDAMRRHQGGRQRR